MLVKELNKEPIVSNEIKYLDISKTVGEHSFTVFPEHLNYQGALFGGKILCEIDIAAIKPIRRMLYFTDCDTAVTARIGQVDFLRPASLGDIIELHSKIFKLGKTSIHVNVNVTREDSKGNIETICNAQLVFVSIKDGNPHPHNFQLNLN